MDTNVLTLIKEKLEKDLVELKKEKQTLKEQGLFSKSDVILGRETEIKELQEYIETLEESFVDDFPKDDSDWWQESVEAFQRVIDYKNKICMHYCMDLTKTSCANCSINTDFLNNLKENGCEIESLRRKIETPINIEDMRKHCEAGMYFKSNGRFGVDPIENGLIDEKKVYEESKKSYVQEKEHQHSKAIFLASLSFVLCAVFKAPDYISVIFAAGTMFLILSKSFKNYDLKFDELYKTATSKPRESEFYKEKE